MSFIADLKALRLGLNWSQAELARKAGLDRETVSRCERGYVIQDVPCAKIKDALIKGGCMQAIDILDGGIPGPVPRKGKAKQREASEPVLKKISVIR